ncbi:hypothetical protein TNCV_4336151 [Trichonephila clavipes]|nr:hypothetical protein TNCV_4336151 [Trichonephila clavipes]
MVIDLLFHFASCSYEVQSCKLGEKIWEVRKTSLSPYWSSSSPAIGGLSCSECLGISENAKMHRSSRANRKSQPWMRVLLEVSSFSEDSRCFLADEDQRLVSVDNAPKTHLGNRVSAKKRCGDSRVLFSFF